MCFKKQNEYKSVTAIWILSDQQTVTFQSFQLFCKTVSPTVPHLSRIPAQWQIYDKKGEAAASGPSFWVSPLMKMGHSFSRHVRKSGVNLFHLKKLWSPVN